MCDALAALKKRGCTNIRFMCIIAAPEGVQMVAEAYPEIPVYVSTHSFPKVKEFQKIFQKENPPIIRRENLPNIYLVPNRRSPASPKPGVLLQASRRDRA